VALGLTLVFSESFDFAITISSPYIWRVYEWCFSLDKKIYQILKN